jgi:DNA polymerase
VTYFGQMKNSTLWGRISLYGGLSFQHRVQAIAADIMALGAINAEENGMPPFALIHDQGLALRYNGKTAEDFSKALGKLPSWATGLPLKVEASTCRWYKK